MKKINAIKFHLVFKVIYLEKKKLSLLSLINGVLLVEQQSINISYDYLFYF